jgi:hypothetical protein
MPEDPDQSTFAGPVLQLQAPQKVPKHLIVHVTEVPVSRFAEKCTELVVADAKIGQVQQVDHVLTLQVEGDFQLGDDEVVVETHFGHGLRTGTFAPQVDDEAVEEMGQIIITELDVGGVLFTGEPVFDLFFGDRVFGCGENGDEHGVGVVEGVAQTS